MSGVFLWNCVGCDRVAETDENGRCADCAGRAVNGSRVVVLPGRGIAGDVDLGVAVACEHRPEELTAKLEVFDEFADEAVRDLVVWLLASRHELVALARGRHVDGHYRYGDRNFLEWGDGQLRAETAQELADAIVYQTRALARAAGRVEA